MPPKIGQYIHLVGNLKPGAKWFCVTLAGKFDSPGVSSRVCAIFGSDAKIIYEAYRGEKRIYQHEATNPISEPVKTNPKIDLRIRFLAEYVQIFAQRGEVGIFRKLPEVHTFRCLQLTGDVINATLMNVDGASYEENEQIKASNICSIYGDVEVLTLKADGKILAPEWGALPKRQ
ncbi:unnamed protein product, partial [Mesorhabditis spiculigera]